MSKAAEEFEELLDQYWSLAFREGKTGESQGSKANEVLSALRNNRHAARAEALREAAEECENYGGFKDGYVCVCIRTSRYG